MSILNCRWTELNFHLLPPIVCPNPNLPRKNMINNQSVIRSYRANIMGRRAEGTVTALSTIITFLNKPVSSTGSNLPTMQESRRGSGRLGGRWLKMADSSHAVFMPCHYLFSIRQMSRRYCNMRFRMHPMHGIMWITGAWGVKPPRQDSWPAH